MDYGYTTIGVKPEYRDLLNEIADYHGLKIVEILPMLICAYANLTPEGREMILDIGSKIVKWNKAGMPLTFNDTLELSETCIQDIANNEA